MFRGSDFTGRVSWQVSFENQKYWLLFQPLADIWRSFWAKGQYKSSLLLLQHINVKDLAAKVTVELVWVAVPSYVDMWLCDGTSWVIDTRLSVLKQFMEHREIMEHASCTVHFLPRVPLKGCFFYRAVKIVQQQRASQDKGRSHKATNSPINNVGLLQRSLEHT